MSVKMEQGYNGKKMRFNLQLSYELAADDDPNYSRAVMHF